MTLLHCVGSGRCRKHDKLCGIFLPITPFLCVENIYGCTIFFALLIVINKERRHAKFKVNKIFTVIGHGFTACLLCFVLIYLLSFFILRKLVKILLEFKLIDFQDQPATFWSFTI